MKPIEDIIARFRATYPSIIWSLMISAIPIGMVLFLHFWKGIPIGNLTRDPTAVGKLPVFTGFFPR